MSKPKRLDSTQWGKGCPATRWDGPYSYRCGQGGDRGTCATHGQFAIPPTPETHPAEELRAAAKTIRDTASKATPGPWTHDFGAGSVLGPGTYIAIGNKPANLDHIAAWHPGTALLVADLLDHAADVIAQYPPEHHPAADPWMPLARAINGTKEEA